MSELCATPLSIIAEVSRVVTRVVDRIIGDRSDSPLLVAATCVEALKKYQIQSQAMYGKAAWIEILEDNTPVWAGYWNSGITFWVTNEYGECIDLSASVAHRQRVQQHTLTAAPAPKTIYAPPLLWAAEVPSFFQYRPEGVAQAELTEPEDLRKFELVLREVERNCSAHPGDGLSESELDFPNEPIICPGKRILDDAQGTFKFYDRALSVRKIPPAPF